MKVRWFFGFFLAFFLTMPVFSKTWIGNCTFSKPLDLETVPNSLYCLSNNTSSVYSIKNLLDSDELFIYEEYYPAMLYAHKFNNGSLLLMIAVNGTLATQPDVNASGINIYIMDVNPLSLVDKISNLSVSILTDASGYDNCVYIGGGILTLEAKHSGKGYLYSICKNNGNWTVSIDNSFGEIMSLYADDGFLYLLNNTEYTGEDCPYTLTKIDLDTGSSQVLATDLCGGGVYKYSDSLYIVYTNGTIYKIVSGNPVYVTAFPSDIILYNWRKNTLRYKGPFVIAALKNGGIYVVNLLSKDLIKLDNPSTYVSIAYDTCNVYGLTDSGDVYRCPFGCELGQRGVSLPPPPTKCGNGICEPDEDPKTCPIDCLGNFFVSPQSIDAYLHKGECMNFTATLIWQYTKKPDSSLIKNPSSNFTIEPKNDQILIFSKIASNTYRATVPVKVCLPEHQFLEIEYSYYLGTDTIEFKVFSEQREYRRELKVNVYEIRKFDLTWIIILLIIAIVVLALIIKKER